MNPAKQRIVDIVQQIPDSIVDTESVLNRVAILERLDRSEQDYRQNGGISGEEMKNRMIEMASKHRQINEG